MLEAHYSNISKAEREANSAKGKLSFAVREGTNREWTYSVYVQGKAHARKAAAEAGATPWNF